MFAELFPYAKEHIFSHARMDYGAVGGCKWRFVPIPQPVKSP